MKKITGISGACANQAKITIRFDLRGRLKQEVEALLGEGFLLSIDHEGFLSGEAEGSFEEICRVKKLLEIRGFSNE